MHNYFTNDVQLLVLIGLAALVGGWVSRIWTLRQVRSDARKVAHATVSQSEMIRDENRELRALVERQEGRLRSLETIATDPAERTAREIEHLRSS